MEKPLAFADLQREVTKVLAINPPIHVHHRMEYLIERGGGHLSKRALAIIALNRGLDLYEQALINVENMFKGETNEQHD